MMHRGTDVPAWSAIEAVLSLPPTWQRNEISLVRDFFSFSRHDVKWPQITVLTWVLPTETSGEIEHRMFLKLIRHFSKNFASRVRMLPFDEWRVEVEFNWR